MSKSLIINLFLLSAILVSCAATAPSGKRNKELSPYDFGLSHARNGEARYRVLYETHSAALAAGVNVNYDGIRSIDLEIPHGAKSIPLTNYNDFAGVIFNVKNTSTNMFLFSMTRKAEPIVVSKRDIDKGSFEVYPLLSKGRNLLVISDDKPWVENREGYSYGHVRKDIILIDNGQAKNEVVMPYNNTNSFPDCQYYPVAADSVVIKGITLNRSKESTAKTYLCSVNGIDNLALRDVAIHTPENDWVSDVAIVINDCTNVTFDNLIIDGTYSRKNHSGYGINMNNIWNLNVRKMAAHANWGVFGTNNINTASFSDSDINRFDIHCYGRDISFNNVIFRDNYNQFASVFGTIRFDNCSFLEFVPIVNGPSYNAYVNYDVIMNDCYFKQTKGTAMLIDEGYLDNRVNSRTEIAKRCLPNITINNLIVDIGGSINKFYLFYFRERSLTKQSISDVSSISINGITFQYDEAESRPPVDFYTSNISVKVESPLQQEIHNVDIIGNASPKNKSRGRLLNRLETRSAKSALRTSNIRSSSITE